MTSFETHTNSVSPFISAQVRHTTIWELSWETIYVAPACCSAPLAHGRHQIHGRARPARQRARRPRQRGCRKRRGVEVSHYIIALTDVVSFLRRACGAHVVCTSAKDCPSSLSLPLEPTIYTIYRSWGGVGDDGLPTFYSPFQRQALIMALDPCSKQISRHFDELVSGNSGCY